MKREQEPEAVDDFEEALAYDALMTAKQGDFLDSCFAKSV